MTSSEILELDTTSICELVGKRFRIAYKENNKEKKEAVQSDKKLIALDYSDQQQVKHYIFSDGIQHIKVPSTNIVSMTQL